MGKVIARSTAREEVARAPDQFAVADDLVKLPALKCLRALEVEHELRQERRQSLVIGSHRNPERLT